MYEIKLKKLDCDLSSIFPKAKFLSMGRHFLVDYDGGPYQFFEFGKTTLIDVINWLETQAGKKITSSQLILFLDDKNYKIVP